MPGDFGASIALLLLGLVLGGTVVWWWLARPLRAEMAALREEKERLALEGAELRTRLAAEERNHREKLEELENRFRTLATDILDHNSRNFLQLVSERFNAHKSEAEKTLEARKKEIESLVRPIAESLAKFEHRVGELEKARQEAYGAITQQVRALIQGQRELSDNTGKLVQALRQPKTRGRWGEYQLRNVLELAGMTEHVDFASERSVAGEEGRLRPDVVVRLPGGKCLVIDAKTPLDAYLSMIEASDEEERARALRDHLRQVREHVRKLSSKEYWQSLKDTPDFVVMFIPGEAFYAAAVEVDPSLFEDALKQRVLITTPATLVALIKAIAYGWRQEKLAENLQEVAGLARDLYDRIKTFGEHMDGVGKALRQAVDRYNRAVGSLEARVLPAARRFEQLRVAPANTEIPAVSQVELEPRALQASELTAEEE